LLTSLSPPHPVPARGSTPIYIGTIPTIEGFQILIDWQQGADTVAPTLRLNLFLDNGVDFASVAQSNCP